LFSSSGSNGSDAEIRSRWKLSFTNDSFMGSVNGGSGRKAHIGRSCSAR
jgi:hypothetical protein